MDDNTELAVADVVEPLENVSLLDTTDVDWGEHAQDFMQRLPEAVHDFFENERPLLPAVRQMVEGLYPNLTTNSPENIAMLTYGFGLGALNTLLMNRPELLDKPDLAKDLALHSAVAMARVLYLNAEEVPETTSLIIT